VIKEPVPPNRVLTRSNNIVYYILQYKYNINNIIDRV